MNGLPERRAANDKRPGSPAQLERLPLEIPLLVREKPGEKLEGVEVLVIDRSGIFDEVIRAINEEGYFIRLAERSANVNNAFLIFAILDLSKSEPRLSLGGLLERLGQIDGVLEARRAKRLGPLIYSESFLPITGDRRCYILREDQLELFLEELGRALGAGREQLLNVVIGSIAYALGRSLARVWREAAPRVESLSEAVGILKAAVAVAGGPIVDRHEAYDDIVIVRLRDPWAEVKEETLPTAELFVASFLCGFFSEFSLTPMVAHDWRSEKTPEGYRLTVVLKRL
ncbi:MAG: hypothetical protein QXU52_02330 [Fervidicoccaceae archaeon]